MVYVFLANGFETIEALAPVDILRRAGADVKTVGLTGENIETSHKVTVKADITVDKVILDDSIDMIVLPGGMPGTLNLEDSLEVRAAVDYCAENGKLIGAICAAPSILGHKGLLDGKNFTCFPGFEKDIENANYTGEPVVTDGKIITGKGAGCCVPFALKLVEMLISKEKADEVAKSLQYI